VSLKIVYIKWFDSFTLAGQKTTEEVMEEKSYIIEDIGFLVGETKEDIRYATSWIGTNEQWKHINSVPKCNIIKKKILGVK